LINRIMAPLLDRLQTIGSLWLWHLNLHRQIDTLSWWEIQRLRLAKQLWNKLTGIMYVLDEPTIGLDDREVQRTIAAIKTLKDMWNTIIVVEHNDEFIKASDWVVEIWPWSWDFGGKLLFSGPYKDFIKSDTLTAQYVTWKKKIHVAFDHTPQDKWIKIKKAHQNNLQNIDVNVRLWWFSIITWPSGAGKTTLMFSTLFSFFEEKQKFIQWYIRLQLLKKWLSWNEIIASPIMKREEYETLENLALQEFYKTIWVETIAWHDNVDNVVYVDQTSIGKTPRSCPATFIGVFDNIRKIFAGVNESKFLGFNAGHFSFNSDKGACPACEGYGYKKIELQFLPDTYVPCDLCHGNRYKSEILSINWKGHNIAQILNMYVYQALELFKDIEFIAEELQLMCDIGLWYLRMWQPAHTLSWWESQRIKLVKHLLKQYKWHSVYFLDEPTVWLHPSDIEKLLLVLKSFLDRWDTILMIEHDKTLLQFADDIIYLDQGKVKK
jgi:excinuclease ABC subunit A